MLNKKKSLMFFLIVVLFLTIFVFYELGNSKDGKSTGKVTLLEPEKSSQSSFSNYLGEDKSDLIKIYSSGPKNSKKNSGTDLINAERKKGTIKAETLKISSFANETEKTYASGEIFEQDGKQYIMRGDKAYITFGITFSPSPPSSVCAGKTGNERINISVQGAVGIEFDYRWKCAFPGGDTYALRLKLKEADTASSDDIIDDEVIYVHKQCTDTDDLYISFTNTFENVDLGSQFGGAEDSGTIEIYATVEPNDKKTYSASTKNFDINKVDNCACISGSCCDKQRRPYVFESSGSQPAGLKDEYFCSGINSPTETSYVKTRDYYCDGKGSSVKSTESTANTCGICAYCKNNYDSCFFYYQKEKCGAKDCDYLDTSCRDYNDIDKVCTGGGKCESLTDCTSYTNKPKGTNCGTILIPNKECDGDGNCLSCTSHAASDCSIFDVYWFDACGNKEDKKTDCGDNKDGANYCYDNDIYYDFTERGCLSGACFSETTRKKRQECGSFGCSDGKCNTNPPTIICSKDSDCGTDSWTGSAFCSSNNVAQKWKTYTCSNPGTTSSSCSSAETDKQKESCASGCTNGACKLSTITCSKNSDCGTNVLTGRTACVSNSNNLLQEWKTYNCNNPGLATSSCYISSMLTVKENCANGCLNGKCIIPTPVDDYPDLVVNDLVIQSIVGKSVVLGFTIKNVGEGTADFVYWMVDVGSNDENPKRTSPISLAPGDSTRAFMIFNYSQPGTYNPMVVVDPENIVEETNEGNNKRAISVSV